MQATLKQPRGLPVFFLTEMWERYGFYVVQGLLVLFLTQKFQLSDSQSYAILGSFTALAYILPIVGGYIADSSLGYRHAILLGGLLLCLGYGTMGFASDPNQFYLGLAVVTVGTGLFKPNVSSLLGTLYVQDDPRRDAGYTLFYVGINMGSILAYILSGYLMQNYGWHASFGSASIGLLLGVIIFAVGCWMYKISDNRMIQPGFGKYIITYVLIGILIVLSNFVLQHEDWARRLFYVMCVIVLLVIGYQATKEHGLQRRRIIAYLLLLIISVVFWAIFFQMFLSLDLFIERVVSHNFFGYNIPTTWFLSTESIGVVVFGPILGMLWTRLHRANRGPSLPGKFCIGIFLIAVAFGLLYLSIETTTSLAMVFPLWLIVSYLVIAISELSLSPIGLAMVVELSPPRLVGMMMGIFFVSLGLGGKLAGFLADYAAIPSNMHDLATIKDLYKAAFLHYAEIALAATVLALIFTPFIKRLMQKDKEGPADMPQL
jgi:POT family proton-dependent oligopeptide transporter